MSSHAASSSVTTEKSDERVKAPSGRLLLRMPRTLHAELARAAEREGTSLNQFITSALSRTVGMGSDDDEAADAHETAARGGQSRVIAAALVANAVVIGLAAVAAIAVLVVALLG
jgi:RNA polymerase sigma-B factor